jgi:hypothetical protein
MWFVKMATGDNPPFSVEMAMRKVEFFYVKVGL